MRHGLTPTFSLIFLCAAAASPAFPVEAPSCGSPAHKCDPKFVEANAQLRLTDPALADDYEKLYSELIALSPDSITLQKDLPDVSASALAEYNRRRHALLDRGVADGGTLDKDGNPAFGTPVHTVNYYVGFSIYVLADKNVPLQYKKFGSDLSGLENQARQLEGDVKAAGGGLSAEAKKPFEARLTKLNADGTSLWNLIHTDALNESDSDYGLGGGKQPLMNPLQARVAALSGHLQSLDQALNGARADAARNAPKISEALQSRMNPTLKNLEPFGPDKGVADGGSASEAESGNKDPKPSSYTLTPAKKTLLDLSFPSPTPNQSVAAAGPKPAVFTGAKGEDAAPLLTKAVNNLRKAGKTETLGDVDRRAGYIFHQTGNTCAIGAQVEVLADLGEVPADPKKLQAKADELYARAVALGYFAGSGTDPDRKEHGSTAWDHVGDLLDRPIRRLYQVSEADLFKDVSSGRMIIVSTDSGRLWHQREYNGQKHLIVVTGVEVSLVTKKPLGYYINDTGTGEGGRFVEIGQFLKSWDKTVVEPL